MKMGIIRDVFKDEDWCRYSLSTIEKDSFGICDRDSNYYNAYDEFERYFGKDFLKPMPYKERIVKEYYYTIKILQYGDHDFIHLFYKNNTNK